MTKTRWKPPGSKISSACQFLFANSRNNTVILLKIALARTKLVQENQTDFVSLTFLFLPLSLKPYLRRQGWTTFTHVRDLMGRTGANGLSTITKKNRENGNSKFLSTNTWYINNFTITAEIHARWLVNFYDQYADRHMNLKFMRRISEREREIRQFVIVKNKSMSVFNAPVLLMTMNFIVTFSK